MKTFVSLLGDSYRLARGAIDVRDRDDSQLLSRM